MKSRILATTAANRRHPIVLFKFSNQLFLASTNAREFPRFCAQTHVFDEATLM
jgi:hypothetical protein